jgi:hypothetical protein
MGRGSAPRAAGALAAALAALLLAAAPAAAKFDPAHEWRTARTAHFVVLFHEGCDDLAARAALLAEEAHALLAPRVGWEPRAPTRLIIADDADEAQGWATPYPYNQVLISPTPPIGGLGFGTTRYDDWLRLVITHEYTHVLQLDMASRLPLALRSVFGRLYFPNALAPEWFVEGLATYEETELTAGGRGRSPGSAMVLRMAALAGEVPGLDEMAVLPDAWPAGQVPYLFGESFLRFLAGRYGRARVAALSQAYGGRPLPFLVESTGRGVLGAGYRELWDAWSADLQRRSAAERDAVRAPTRPTPLTADGRLNLAPAWSPDGARVAWLRSDGHEYPGIWVAGADGSGRRKLADTVFPFGSAETTLSWSPDGARLYATRPGFIRGAAQYNDLWAFAPAAGRWTRLTEGLRARDPHPSPDGRTLALVTAERGTTRLALLDLAAPVPVRDPARLRFLSEPAADQYFAPRWSPDGSRIAVGVRLPGGAGEIRVLDPAGRVLARTPAGPAAIGAPAWSPDGREVLFSADRTGIFNVFAWTPATGGLRQLTDAVGGVFCPAPSPDGRTLALVEYTERGYDLGTLDLAALRPGRLVAPDAAGDQSPAAPAAPPPAPLASAPYSPLDTVLPRLWLPWLGYSPASGSLYGFITGGQDALARHAYTLSALYGPDEDRLIHTAVYAYDRWRPTLRLLSSDVDRGYGGLVSGPGGAIDYWERERTVGADLVLGFPGFDSSQSLSLGYRYRELSPLTDLPDAAAAAPGAPFAGRLGSTRAAWGFSSAHRQAFSISPADGATVALGLERYQEGLGSDLSFTRASADWAQFLALPARDHVLAARLFVGGASGEVPAQGAFLLGGGSPGDVSYALDDRSLLLRGYPAGAFRGERAALASVEYRFPLTEDGRGGVSLPLFLRRVHGALFVDAGEAWDGDAFSRADVRVGVGAELRVDFFLSYFVPATLRLGIAAGLDEGGGVYPTLGIWLPQAFTGASGARGGW